MRNLVLKLHGIHIAIRYDQMMPQFRNRVRLVLPVLLLFVLYWPGLTTWFYQDDFGWLNLRHDVQSAGDLANALFAPKAHGNMRPLGENAYWLGLSAVFGVEPLPFHLWTFATQAGSLLLLGAIVERCPENLCDDDVTVLMMRANARPPHYSLRERLRAVRRFFRLLIAGVINPRAERAPFPDANLANIGGAIIPALGRRWRATRTVRRAM